MTGHHLGGKPGTQALAAHITDDQPHSEDASTAPARPARRGEAKTGDWPVSTGC
ncbi:hypothetical protein ACWD9X_20460 [Streptomyces sp. NPDC005075]